MSAHLLLVVVDTFEIIGRGVVADPMIELADLTAQLINVELRRPDGTTLVADARVEAVRISPWRPGVKSDNVLRFPKLRKSDIPIGTEIWMRVDGSTSPGSDP